MNKNYNNNNNNNNKNNNNNNNIVLLNPFIFQQLSYLISYKRNFKELLELSLLSKQSFKIFQKLLKYDLINLKIPISLNWFLNYLNREENDINYKFKLIQYNDLILIKLNYYNKNEINDSDNEEEEEEKEDDDYLNNKIKIKLNKFCKSLKNVHLNNQNLIITKYYGEEKYGDYTQNGFFSFEKILLRWYEEYYPISNRKENVFRYMDRFIASRSFNFSFQVIKNYNPKKIIITTTNLIYSNQDDHNDNEDDDENNVELDINNLNGILINSSPKSIKFINHTTPIQFIKKVLKPSNENKIKSFTILFDNIEGQEFKSKKRLKLNENGEEEEEEEEQIEEEEQEEKEESLYKNQINDEESLYNLCEDLKFNKTLKKFIINKGRYGVFGKDPTKLLELISNHNKTLNKLGLHFYEINDYNLLSPLINSPNITTLYCNENSKHSFLKHCKYNDNIKKLYLLQSNNNISTNLKTFKKIELLNKPNCRI